MNLPLLSAVLCSLAFGFVPSSSTAAYVSLGRLVTTPNYFTGFEQTVAAIGSPSVYIENGIRVEQFGQTGSEWINTTIMSQIYPGMLFSGAHSWYPNGGDNGYTKISLVSGDDFGGMSALIGNGHGNSDGITGTTGSTIGNWGGRVSLNYILLQDDNFISSGSLRPAGRGAIDVSFIGTGFDAILLSATYGDQLPTSGGFQALAIDDIRIGSIPEPSTFYLVALAALLLGASYRHRPSILSMFPIVR